MEEHCREGAPWGAPIVSGAGAGMDRRLILACSTGRMLMLAFLKYDTFHSKKKARLPHYFWVPY